MLGNYLTCNLIAKHLVMKLMALSRPVIFEMDIHHTKVDLNGIILTNAKSNKCRHVYHA